MIIFLIAGLLLGALAVIFALQNVTSISVVFLAWHLTGSLALILLVSVALGVVISMLFSIPEVLRKNFKIIALNRENKKLKADIELLKSNVRTTQPLAPAQDSLITRDTTPLV